MVNTAGSGGSGLPEPEVDPQYGAPIGAPYDWSSPQAAVDNAPDTGGGNDDGGGGGGGGGSGGSGGSGGDSSGAEGTGTTSAGHKDYNDADKESRFLGIAGDPEIWKDSTTGQMFIVHFAAGVEPPVPLLYEIPDMDTAEAFFGEGVKVVFDKTISTADMNSTGAVRFGTTNNLSDTEGDPWVGFLDRIERLKEVSPWVEDDEILALIGGAYLEDRDIEDWELKTTDWWQEHTEEEREWLSMSMGDPASAQRKLDDDRLYVSSLFEKIGAEGNDPEMINWMASQYTTGAWSQTELASQVEAITSGWGTVNEDLDTWMTDQGMESTKSEQHFDKVREIFNTWLGPAYAPTDEQVAKWGATLRNTADGEDSLIEMLRGQRLALFPEYTNPALSWKDISAPWKNMTQSTWGVPIQEDDVFFQDLVRTNNANEASKMLRSEGYDRGIDRVVNEMISGVGSGMGSNVRGTV